MRTNFCSLLLLVLLVSAVTAEASYPDYESLPPKVRQVWGLRVQRDPASVTVSFPAKSGKICRKATLYLADAHGHLIMETDLSLDFSRRGGRTLKFRLAEDFRGTAMLVITTSGSVFAPDTPARDGFLFTLTRSP